MTRYIWIPALLLTAACSFPTEPSATATAAKITPQSIVTNAPGGIPTPADTPAGISCPSVIPSYRIESDWPKATHVSADWGHNASAVQVEIVLTNRDTLKVTTLKPNEHTNGAGAVSHHAEQTLPLGIYDGTVTYVYPFCRSRTASFNGLNHGVQSLPNINEPALTNPTVPQGW